VVSRTTGTEMRCAADVFPARSVARNSTERTPSTANGVR
jgi:hypothetical protein